jgi:hypothetical protein
MKNMRFTSAFRAAALACAFAVPAASFTDTPDAYLDYVESTGSQYIDTGVTGKSGTRMVAEMEWVARPSIQSTFCGASDGGKYVTPYTSAGSHQVGYASLSQYQIQDGGKSYPDIRFRVETTLEAGSQTINVRALDGSGYNGSRTYNDAATVNLGCSLYLFARNDSGTANQYSSARIFSLMLWQKDSNDDWQLVRHFLPCRKDNRAALYDKVEGVIHFPQGVDLVAGPVLPRPIDLVEWVQSDGADGDRQLYIDTGVVGKAGAGMTAELLWPVRPSVASTVCGAMADSTHHLTLYTSAGTHQIGYANYSAFQVNSGTSVAYAGKRYRVTSSLAAKAQNLRVEDLDGTGYNGSRSFNDANSIDTAQTLYLFARNDAGTPNQFSHVRLYSLTLTNELGLARNFLPCVADNGHAGLYDTVSQRVFFPQAAVNGATAEFSLSTEVGAVTNNSVSTKWPRTRPEWIEANGTNDYVDLGIIARDGTRMLAEVKWNALADAGTFCGAATNDTRGLFTTYRITTGENSNFHRMGYYNGSSTLGGAHCAPVAGVRYRVETSLTDGEQTIAVKKFDNGAWVPVGNGTRTVNLSFPAGFANLGIPLYLFARNLNGVADEFAPARLYAFKLWQDEALVRDLYPVFDPADNAPALFDKVSKRYFRDDGGYRLTAGGETTPFPGQATFLIFR